MKKNTQSKKTSLYFYSLNEKNISDKSKFSKTSTLMLFNKSITNKKII